MNSRPADMWAECAEPASRNNEESDGGCCLDETSEVYSRPRPSSTMVLGGSVILVMTF